MTERDQNIVCGVIVSSYLDFATKERLCALVRTLGRDTTAGDLQNADSAENSTPRRSRPSPEAAKEPGDNRTS